MTLTLRAPPALAAPAVSVPIGMAELCVLALAAAVYGTGIGYGMPYWMVNDELPLIGGALRMLELQNPIPSLNPGPMQILYYPPGLPWLYLIIWTPILAIQWIAAGFPAPQAFADHVLADLGPLWLAARWLSVAFALGTVWVVMQLTREILNDRRASVLAGVLMATSLHHALLAHFARAWPATVFFFWWGLWAAWRIYADGRRRDYVWAALAAGLGFAVNYVGVLVSIAVAAAHVLRHRRLVVDRAVLLHAAIVAAFLAVILAASWQNFLRLGGFSSILSALPGVEANRPQGQPGAVLIFYAQTLAKVDPVLMAVGGLGLFVLARRAAIFLLLYAAAFAPYALLLITGFVDDDRYILPLTPLLAISAGALVGAVWARAPALGLACAVLVVAFPLAAAIQVDRLLLRDDPRLLARDRLLGAREGGIVSVMRAVKFPQDKGSLALQASLDPDSLSARDRRRLAGAPAPASDVEGVTALHLWQLTPAKLRGRSGESLYDELSARGYRWYVRDDLMTEGAVALDETVRRRARKVATFAPGPEGSHGPIPNLTDQFARGGAIHLFRIERLGPVVEIWQMQEDVR
jgi:hypothetical protein